MQLEMPSVAMAVEHHVLHYTVLYCRLPVGITQRYRERVLRLFTLCGVFEYYPYLGIEFTVESGRLDLGPLSIISIGTRNLRYRGFI